MKELEIEKTKGTSYVKTFSFVYYGPLVFPFSYSFIVKEAWNWKAENNWKVENMWSLYRKSYYDSVSSFLGVLVVEFSNKGYKIRKIFA